MNSEHEDGACALRLSDRDRKMTGKGQLFAIENLEKRLKNVFKYLQTLSKQIDASKAEDNQKAVQQIYHAWLNSYEAYLTTRAEYCGLVPQEEDTFEMTDIILSSFKSCMEEWFLRRPSSPKPAGKTIEPHDSVSQVTRRKSTSRISRHSSIHSSIASLRIKEEQKRVELSAKKTVLSKKQDLELAKVKLRFEEEKLDLETDIEIANARKLVLDEMETQSMFTRSIVHDSTQKVTPNVSHIVQEVDLTKVSQDDTNVKSVHDVKPSDSVNHSQSANVNPSTNVNHNMYNLTLQPNSHAAISDHCDISNRNPAEQAIISVVRQLRKPIPDIKKFYGDPLEYQRFIRQFKTKVVNNCEDSDECMNYLDQFTGGEANKVVTGFSYLSAEDGYYAALRELNDRYGQAEVLANAFVKRALTWPNIKADNPKSIDEFSIFLEECQNAIQCIEAVKVLQYPENMRQMVAKLPFHYHDKWRNVVQRCRDNHQPIEFHQLVSFVKTEAKKANDTTYGRDAMRIDTSALTKKQTQKSTLPLKAKGTFATKVTESEPEHISQKSTDSSPHLTNIRQTGFTGTTGQKGNALMTPCLYCANPRHSLESCDNIMTLTHSDRINFLKTKGLCFGCLKRGHLRSDCRFKVTCHQCQGRHPTICHYSKLDNSQTTEPKVTTFSAGACAPIDDQTIETGAGDHESTMAILPVSVKMNNGLRVIQTYAFLDSGSSVSFITGSLMRQLGAAGKQMKITVDTMGEPQTLQTYAVQGLQIGDLQMSNKFQLPKVYTKDRMPVGKNHIPTKADVMSWPHLRDIDLPHIDSEIGLLLGNNIADAYTPLEIRTGPMGSPHATRSRLGWILWGVIRSTQTANSQHFSVNKAEIVAIEKAEEMKSLDALVRQSVNLDFPERAIDDVREHSQDDKRFLIKVNDSISHSDGHYYINLPFKNDYVVFPNNELQVRKRLNSLKSRMESDKQFHDDYKDFMDNILTKGYAEEVPTDELQGTFGRVWYIPHHGVYHPRKPKKLRVVFDCTAVHKGVSLNNNLLPGPDLTNNLIGVLLRFRDGNIAIMADIESMFYQVRIPRCDSDYLRFLWWPGADTSHDPVVYRMVVHLFGAVSSPSCSNAALKRTADDNQHSFSEAAVQAIHNDFYVDDYLAAVDTEKAATTLIKEVSALCQTGGFNLTKWVTNSHAVMATIPPEKRCKDLRELDLDHDPLPCERALGVYWDVETDTFGYHITAKTPSSTRRGILSTVSSTYDPLGQASPFVLSAKILLQGLCHQNLGWDEAVDGKNLRTWTRWLSDLSRLPDLQMARCYKPREFGTVSTTQLHIFSDASDEGYGVVIYMRLVDVAHNIHCSFVLAKSRVAPLKKITIPRLELSAATVAVRLCIMVTREIDINIDKIHFWTDSASVLRYISNDSARFHTFVANRVNLIREMSEPDQWSYIDSKTNPADCASRGMTMDKLLSNEEWIHGPKFLWKPENEWPQHELNRTPSPEDPEVKRTVLSTTVKSSSDVMDRLLTYHSDWHKLRKTVAWILLAMQNLRKKIQQRNLSDRADNLSKVDIRTALRNVHLTTDLLSQAENVIFKYEQGKHFAEEIQSLKTASQKETRISRSSSLSKLDPILVDGILRVGGRLGRADIPFESRHPIIIPKESTVSQLILRHCHRSVGHLGRNSILNVLREKYWLVGASTAIKTLLSKCVVCRSYQARAFEQKMADLPVERITPGQPCFTNVGMDYFGPFEVKRGRSKVKRYGVIFTCMASRAVHLEVASSLDTDSCVNAVRRFIARRGPVDSIRSDNGTNLVGCERELREEIERWNQAKIHQTLLQKNITWIFNPPSGSHFGGVWERMIRSVRKILYSLLHQQVLRLDDESLQTLFCEVEATLNGRPITEVPNSTTDIEALTPNHLLLLRSGDSLPPGQFNASDNYPQRRWRQVQYLSDLFWKRWIKDYLPLLQERQKWVLPRKNVNTGDLVLIVENTPRNSWSLARVVQTIPDKKGYVRIVKVQTKNSVLLRPVDKLCLVLEADA